VQIAKDRRPACVPQRWHPLHLVELTSVRMRWVHGDRIWGTNIQPVKPATKKKTMSAIVATAKLRSARRDRSHPFVDGLAFVLICCRVRCPIGPIMAHAPSPTRPPIFPALASSTPWVNPIWPADRGSVRRPKSSRIWLSIFAKAPPLACLPFRCHSQPDGCLYRFTLYGKDSFQVLRLDHPLALALKHDELDRRGHLMKAAEEPDEKDDRDRYTDQPKQKTSPHNSLLLVSSQPNVGSELKFHGPSQPTPAARASG
jgi:hypothetical protein